MDYPFYDKFDDLRMWADKDLPHCEQKGIVQFVTFRLGDSLPQSRIAELKEAREIFKANNPEPWSEETTMKFRNLVGRFESKLLDKGYGSCILRDPRARSVVEESLHYNDKVRYDLIAYVVMPNHVHVLFRPYPDSKLEEIIHTLKSFTATRINKSLGRRGNVWMSNYFDRMVRSEEHLEYCIKYIRQNPRFLKAADYALFIDPSCGM